MKTTLNNFLEVIENMKRWHFEQFGSFGIYDTLADQLRSYRDMERKQIIKAYEQGFHAGYIANENSFLNNKPSGVAYFHKEYGKNIERNDNGKTDKDNSEDK